MHANRIKQRDHKFIIHNTVGEGEKKWMKSLTRNLTWKRQKPLQETRTWIALIYRGRTWIEPSGYREIRV